MKEEKKRWIKAAKIILGVALLCWDILQKKPVDKKEKTAGQKKYFGEDESAPVTKNEWQETAEWLKANPKSLPYPTYWPFFLAVGLVLLFWGILTSWVISLVGLLVFIISLAGWINILRYEKRINKN